MTQKQPTFCPLNLILIKLYSIEKQLNTYININILKIILICIGFVFTLPFYTSSV